MRNSTCCFTGHRSLDIPIEILEVRLKNIITDLVNKNVIYYGAGGALGFDTLAALTVIKLRREYPQIKLILVLPCKDQTSGWESNDIQVYNYILEQADKVVYTAEAYYPGCMHKRNRHLVDNSAYCICFKNKASGGTAYTVDYAQKSGLRIHNLATDNFMEVHNA